MYIYITWVLAHFQNKNDVGFCDYHSVVCQLSFQKRVRVFYQWVNTPSAFSTRTSPENRVAMIFPPN